MDTLSKFGQLSRRLRMGRGFTIADQSRELGLSPSDISRIEVGLSKADLVYIKKFSDWVGADLISHQELIKSSSAQLRKEIPQNDANSRLYRKMNKLTPVEIRSLGNESRGKLDAG